MRLNSVYIYTLLTIFNNVIRLLRNDIRCYLTTIVTMLAVNSNASRLLNVVIKFR